MYMYAHSDLAKHYPATLNIPNVLDNVDLACVDMSTLIVQVTFV